MAALIFKGETHIGQDTNFADHHQDQPGGLDHAAFGRFSLWGGCRTWQQHLRQDGWRHLWPGSIGWIECLYG